MTLSPGTKRGSYEILTPLGAGGMGEVYRARDTRLQRDVAIKVLPRHLADDPERLARLGREARLLASLNHPNVAAIHGLEEADGSPFLVMEYVEGESLAQRLSAGPLPVDDALAIATEIAAGLEAAHAAGVIHRDLKPANVMVRPDGSVKVLDLGLARTVESATTTDPSMSPTVTSGGTAAGVILGTAAYMSPEQARGKLVDKRTDVFSFGCVVYETLTGKRAFPGENISDTLASILRSEPDWGALPGQTPAAVRKLLRRCLEKDPKRRLRDIGDARLDIDEALAAPGSNTGLPLTPEPRRRTPLLWALAGALLGIVVTFSVGRQFGRPTAPAGSTPVRAVLPLPPDARLDFAQRPAIAVSPDNRTVIFRAVEGEIARLYRRDLSASEAKPIAGTEGGFAPFISPDGEWLGFFTSTELKKVPLSGGSPIRISLMTPVTGGGAWDTEGNIVFTLTMNGPLSRIP
jgi:serine/threonine protein kinase